MVKIIGVDMAENKASITCLQVDMNGEIFDFFRPFPEELPSVFAVEHSQVKAFHDQGFHPTALLREGSLEMFKLETTVLPVYTYKGMLMNGTYKEQEVGRIGVSGAKGPSCSEARGVAPNLNNIPTRKCQCHLVCNCG